MGNDPRNFQGRRILAVLHRLRQTVREKIAIAGLGVFRLDCSFLTACMSASRHSDNTPDINQACFVR